MVPLGPELNSNKMHNFGPLQLKLYGMLSRMKMEEHIESELSGNFQVKLLAKSMGTQFMHQRVKHRNNA